MITIVRSVQIAPGKLGELLPLAKEICDIAKRVMGVDIAFATAFGGNLSDVAWIWQRSDMGQVEDGFVKMMADAAYRQALMKLQGLLIPGMGRDQYWRHT
jgi:hypothetical protein